MKDYNEMAKAVFERRDEYLATRKKNQALFFKACVPVCSLVLVTMMGLLLWNSNTPVLEPTPPEYSKYNEHTATETESTNNTDNTFSANSETLPVNTDGTSSTNSQLPQTNPRPTEQSSQNIPQPTAPIYTPQTKPPTSSDDTNSGDAPATSVPDSTGGNEGDWAEPSDYPHWPDPTDAPVTETPTAEPTTPRPPSIAGDPSVEAPTEEPTAEPTEAPTRVPIEVPTESPAVGAEERTRTVCVDDKEYVAQVGQSVIYTVELEAERRFENIHVELEYGKGMLEFVVKKGGWLEMDFWVKDMSINGTDLYFFAGSPVITEEIDFYQYLEIKYN